jgi:hypothetical protein
LSGAEPGIRHFANDALATLSRAQFGFTRVEPLDNWPKSETSDFGWERERKATYPRSPPPAIIPVMRNPLFAPAITRFRVTPEDPFATNGPRPRGSRRPHTDAKVLAVRKLVEETALTYGEIEAKTGVGRASICRWTRDGGWQRPLFAPRATDTVPRPRASAKLKRRLLAERLSALAERYVAELETTPGVDLEKLAQALMLMRMIKLAARPKRRRSGNTRAIHGAERTALDYEDAGTILARLRSAGVDLAHAPDVAVQDFIDAHLGPRDDDRHFRARGGHRSRRNKGHARLLERD